MNNSMRQDPWSLMPRLQDEINRLFGNVNQNESSSVTASWIPAVDIQEYADRFEFFVDIPGVDPNGPSLVWLAEKLLELEAIVLKLDEPPNSAAENRSPPPQGAEAVAKLKLQSAEAEREAAAR